MRNNACEWAAIEWWRSRWPIALVYTETPDPNYPPSASAVSIWDSPEK